MSKQLELKKTLSAFHLWVIGVGIVISGNYFGWNFGLAASGYIGMLIAIGVMAVMYLFMCFGISELSTALPYAGGPYSFARRAMGPFAGFLTGIGVILEYFIAAPVVAIGIGAYINFLFPTINPILAAAFMCESGNDPRLYCAGLDCPDVFCRPAADFYGKLVRRRRNAADSGRDRGNLGGFAVCDVAVSRHRNVADAV